MDAATENSTSETQDRLALLLIAQPREGWEAEFEELIRREIERLVVPVGEQEHDE
jgi:hypothetical protein